MPQSIRVTTAARAAVFAPIAGGGRAELVAQRLTDAIDLGLLGGGEKLPSEAAEEGDGLKPGTTALFGLGRRFRRFGRVGNELGQNAWPILT